LKIALFERPNGDRPFTALVLLLTGVFVLACQDSLVKLMAPQTSFWQFQILRSVSNVCFVLLLALSSGGLELIKAQNWRPVYLRSAFLIVCMFFFFAGSPYLSISQMAAGLYTYPLFVSLLATPILGEKVGIWRMGALALGAIGAVCILSPWHEDFSSIQLLPIIAGFFYACNILTLRRACRNESPLALAFATGIFYVASGLIGITALSLFPLSKELAASMPFIAIGWPELSLVVVGFALLASVLNLTGNISMSRAYQTADSSWLAPLDFSYLLFAAIWGRILFDNWPTTTAIIGMSLIASAGIITAWRESKSGK
jgi:drug/metabolite transporter (DMT)-like permease